MQMRDELGTIYDDQQFADLFPNAGKLALSSWRLVLVTVMQFAENLTDCQAADAVQRVYFSPTGMVPPPDNNRSTIRSASDESRDSPNT